MKKLLFLLLALPTANAFAQTSALEGIERIRKSFGNQAVSNIVSMTGTKGQPQPREWYLLSYDPSGPYKLHYYWVDRARATDEGFDDEVYASGAPAGFLQFEKLKIDSTDAFERANVEARNSKVDFDRIDYTLRCREFSTDPVWSLNLFFRGRYVGKLDLSGINGNVFRAVWVKYGPQYPRGFAVEDSEFPGSGGIAAFRPEDPPVGPGPIDPIELDPPVGPVPPTGPGDTDPLGGITPPDPLEPSETLQKGIPVDDKPGHVRSPFAPDAGLVDVRGIESGTKVRCPYTEKVFLVP